MDSCILFDKYRIIKILCNHPDSIVYFAQHVMLQEYCIIKELKKDNIYFLHQLKEAEILKFLYHPCIPKLYEVLETKTCVYLVEEFMEGTSLQDVCSNEHLQEQTIISYGIQLCNLIYYLHTANPPVLHLDIKPSNLIIHQGRVALIDFSAAKYITDSDSICYGTPLFAAPEQYQKAGISVQTDIYGVGAVLYRMVSGGEFNNTGRQCEISCSYPLAEIIHRCLRQESSMRYESIQDVAGMLMQLRRQQGRTSTKELYCYAVAGTQNRIGTTHFAMQMCSYLMRHQVNCLYVEQNQSRAVYRMLHRYGRLDRETRVYQYESLPMIPFSWNAVFETDRYQSYDVAVFDFGVLDQENLSAFGSMEQQFLLYGNKVTEEEAVQKAMILAGDFKQICFVGNFQTAASYQNSRKWLKKCKSVRLPYEPDWKDYSRQSATWQLFDKLLDRGGYGGEKQRAKQKGKQIR